MGSDDLQRLEPVPLQRLLDHVGHDLLPDFSEPSVVFGYKGEKLLLALLSERQLWADPPALGVCGVIGPLGQLVICCRGRLRS